MSNHDLYSDLPFPVIPIFLAGFQFFEHFVEAREIGFPDAAVIFKPLGGFGEPARVDAAGAALGVAAAGDKAGTFEDAEVLGDGGLGHREGAGELVNGGFAGAETGEDGAAGGIGERGEGGVESLFVGHCITC